MKKFLKTNAKTLILISAIVLGGLIGLILGEKATVLKPLGDVFMNLMFVILVPMIFLSISNSIVKIGSLRRMGKILFWFAIVMLSLSLIVSILGYCGANIFSLIGAQDASKLEEMFGEDIILGDESSILNKLVTLFTVSDFAFLFSKDNLMAIFVASIIFGFAVRMGKDKTENIAKAIDSLNTVVLNILKIVMYYAPVGLACYFAAVVGTFGNEVVYGFLKTLLVYTGVCIVVYFILLPIVVLIFRGKSGLKLWFAHILVPSITAIATCSSAASMPICIEETKKMNVDNDVVETVIPLGTNFFKSGAIVGSVFKIIFLMSLFDVQLGFLQVVFVSILAALLVGAVPTGGGAISEMFILSFLGFPAMALPLLTIIATIIDPFSTVTSVAGNITCATVVDRCVNYKNLRKKQTVNTGDESDKNIKEIVDD